MAYEFRLPDIGEGVVEGEIVRWLVTEGQDVQEDEPMVEVMTDKATVDISSPVTGTIKTQHFGEGTTCPVGAVLVTLDAAEGAVVPAGGNGHARGAPVVAEEAAAPAPTATAGKGKVRAAPATRRLARDLGVDLQSVQGTGPASRVTREDVQRSADAMRTPTLAVAPAPAAAAAAAPTPRPTLPPPAPLPAADGPEETREPLRGVRKVIAETMRRAKDRAAHFTYVDEVDCKHLVEARARLKPLAAERGVKLTYLPFILKATIQGLRAYPLLNAEIDDARGEIVTKHRYHLGVAAATEQGLMVPVVRDADRKSIFELATELQALGERARANRLGLEELRGSTFTITSLGALGGVLATPIVNDPEVAILGVHQMKDRAVVVDGEIVVRPVMNLACSFDHRLIDGHVGAAFVQVVKSYLTDPARLLMDLR